MLVPFASLPDDARIWIFAASEPLEERHASELLGAVDAFLEHWKAHGDELTCGREWRDDRFLVIGVDQSTAGASGCSIDGLFRILQQLQSSLGVQLVAGGRIFYRGADGSIQTTDRAGFARLGAAREVDASTPVFDPTLTVAADYRERFEQVARSSWHGALIS
jgi:hypothetical protein